MHMHAILYAYTHSHLGRSMIKRLFTGRYVLSSRAGIYWQVVLLQYRYSGILCDIVLFVQVHFISKLHITATTTALFLLLLWQYAFKYHIGHLLDAIWVGLLSRTSWKSIYNSYPHQPLYFMYLFSRYNILRRCIMGNRGGTRSLGLGNPGQPTTEIIDQKKPDRSQLATFSTPLLVDVLVILEMTAENRYYGSLMLSYVSI